MFPGEELVNFIEGRRTLAVMPPSFVRLFVSLNAGLFPLQKEKWCSIGAFVEQKTLFLEPDFSLVK